MVIIEEYRKVSYSTSISLVGSKTPECNAYGAIATPHLYKRFIAFLRMW